MLRHLFIFSSIILLVSCGESEKPNSTNKIPKSNSENSTEINEVIVETPIEEAASSNLNGVWHLVEKEYKGKKMPINENSSQRLEIQDSVYTLMAKKFDKGIIKYFGNQIDIYSKEGINEGKHFKGLYKVENGVLTLCYDLSGENYPGEFTTTAEDNNFLAVFKKQ